MEMGQRHGMGHNGTATTKCDQQKTKTSQDKNRSIN